MLGFAHRAIVEQGVSITKHSIVDNYFGGGSTRTHSLPNYVGLDSGEFSEAQANISISSTVRCHARGHLRGNDDDNDGCHISADSRGHDRGRT